MSKLFLSTRDFLWVLAAYLRGKVLRLKAFRPLHNIFYKMTGYTPSRGAALRRWWGLKPATFHDRMSFDIAIGCGY